MTTLRRYRYTMVLVLAVTIFGWIGLTQHLGAGRDDVFITLYAGESLAKGDGIVNHNGERVEMSSSLLQTGIIALIYLIAPSYTFTLNRLVGAAFGALMLVEIYRGRGVLFPVGRWRFVAYTITMALAATNPAIVYWSFGGLEAPYAMTFLTAYAVMLLYHRLRPTFANEFGMIAAQCLFVTTRPEGFYLLLFTLVYLILMRFIGRRPIRWRVLLVPAGWQIALMTFRLFYFGALFPNTVYAKSGNLNESVKSGLTYAVNFYSAGYFLWAVLAVQLVLFAVYARYLVQVARTYPRRTPVPLSTMLVFGITLAAQLVVICSGGDWMEHFRFFVPVLPLLITMTVVAVFQWIERFVFGGVDKSAGAGPLTVAAVAAIVANVYQSDLNIPRPFPRNNAAPTFDYKLGKVFANLDELDRTIMNLNHGHSRDLRLLKPFLDETLPDLHAQAGRLVIATSQMGIFPYLIKNGHPDLDITFIDTLGLCDEAIAHMPLNKDHTGVADGRWVDEILDGKVPLIEEYLMPKSPNMVYFLGFDPSTDERMITYARHGFFPVLEKKGAYVLFKDGVRP